MFFNELRLLYSLPLLRCSFWVREIKVILLYPCCWLFMLCMSVLPFFFLILQFNELGLFSSLALLRCSVWLREVNGWLFDLIFSYFSTFFVCFGKFRALLMSIVNAFLYVCPLFC